MFQKRILFIIRNRYINDYYQYNNNNHNHDFEKMMRLYSSSSCRNSRSNIRKMNPSLLILNSSLSMTSTTLSSSSSGRQRQRRYPIVVGIGNNQQNNNKSMSLLASQQNREVLSSLSLSNTSLLTRRQFSSSSSCMLSDKNNQQDVQQQQQQQQQQQPKQPKQIFHRDRIIQYPNSKQQLWSKNIPDHIRKPSYALNRGIVPYSLISEQIQYHNDDMVNQLRYAAQCASNALYYTTHTLLHPNSNFLQIGSTTTNDIDRAVHEYIINILQCYPSPLLYSNFPKSICTSINEIICHGIPDDRPIQYGDIISIDISLYTSDGVHGDNCATVIIGDINNHNVENNNNDKENNNNENNKNNKDWRGVDYKMTFDTTIEERNHYENGRRLMNATLDSLYAGIEQCYPGNNISAIGNAIHDVVDTYQYSTIQRYRGHGISSIFHTAPYISHYRTTSDPNSDTILQHGMIFTIEPMIVNTINVGNDCYEWDIDDWTVSCNNSTLLSCQFEHTVYINDITGVEILTRPTFHPEIIELSSTSTLSSDNHNIIKPPTDATYY